MPFQICYFYDINSVSCDAVVTDIGERYCDYGADKTPDSLDSDFSTTVFNGFELIPANRKNCRYIIHAPAYAGSFFGEDFVRFCYIGALQLVSDLGLNSVAFPLLGRDMESVSNEAALQIASEEIYGYLQAHPETYIYLVIQHREEFQPDPLLLEELSDYVNRQKQKIIRLKEQKMLENVSTGVFPAITAEDIDEVQKKQLAQRVDARTQNSDDWETKKGILYFRPERRSRILREAEERANDGLVIPIESLHLDESFSQMVLRKIDERGFKKDSDCYTRANMDRRVFSRLRSDKNYHPKKTTAIALAVALEMSLEETKKLLMKAGYSLSPSILFDVIIEFCISRHLYNIFIINELLVEYEQPLLFEWD